ncbi:YgeY family selenium metabolism-linked hydrolase [bacterium]|nr:YgeY family selenium metabolism-linked hydrolase [bacterium]
MATTTLGRRVDGRAIMAQAEKYRDDMVKFLRDLIRIPSESAQEEKVVRRIKAEMEKLDFDEIVIDGFGNIRGRVGNGSRKFAIDAHIDTVGVGDPDTWKWDPFEGKVENNIIYGRGACDQTGGMVSAVYAGRILKDLGIGGDYSVYMVGSIMEEDCDGLPWLYILREENPGIECVIITEPTDLRIYRGHRGRMEIEVTTKGLSCHGSAPERGVNAVYKMAPVVKEVEALNKRLRKDAFLGKGTVTISDIRATSPSLCAVADSCTIHLDRRLTAGETKELAVSEVKAAAKRAGVPDAQVRILEYNRPTWRNKVYPMEKYYPTWVFSEDHPLIQSAAEAYRRVFGKAPNIGKWTFSTNGVAIAGLCGVPCFGFGPAEESTAHSPMDQCPIDHLVKAAAFYAQFVPTYVETTRREDIRMDAPPAKRKARKSKRKSG